MSNGIKFFNPNFVGTKEDALRWIVDKHLSQSVLGRSIFTETALLNATKFGCREYLIFASGYDTFAYRSNINNLKVFEIDKSEMIQDKIRRLDNNKLDYSKVNFIKCDFIDIDWISNIINSNYNRNEIFVKEIPSYVVYYCDAVISDFSKIPEFVLESGNECIKANPDLKCISPDYCYVSYLDGEYKEKDIKIRYAQAVEKEGVETDRIKFMTLDSITAVCIYHKGSYENLRDSYNIILKYIEDSGYEIIDNVRECYIDGCWNKDAENDYLTEIQFPVRKKQYKKQIIC